MTLIISDREVAFGPDNVPVVLTGKPLFVTATPTQTPLFVRDTQGREQDQSGPRKAPVDPTAGTWSHTLPWPSETSNGLVPWQLRRMDGTIVQGVVPEGITGPVSVDYLLTGLPSPFTAWQVVQAGQVPAQVVATSPLTDATPTQTGLVRVDRAVPQGMHPVVITVPADVENRVRTWLGL